MKVTYQSKTYAPELVTGRYVRCSGKRGAYLFIVFETATGVGRYTAKPGQGPTLREYVTDGKELPAELRQRAIETKMTERWD